MKKQHALSMKNEWSLGLVIFSLLYALAVVSYLH